MAKLAGVRRDSPGQPSDQEEVRQLMFDESGLRDANPTLVVGALSGICLRMADAAGPDKAQAILDAERSLLT